MFFSSSSPTVVLPPPQPPHHHPSPSTSTYNPSPFGSSASWAQFTPKTSSNSTSAPLPVSRGRKRSRDETDLEDDGSLPQAPLPAPEPEPVYGEGMTLICPSGFIISAGSQTGTWAEEVAASKAPPSPPAAAEPALRLLSRKSQRLDTSHPPSTTSPNSPPTTLSSSPTHTEPQIDASTILLGIGWTALASSSSTDPDESAAAAIRGWARYIANHYSISNPAILLRSAGLSAYLVQADEGFFLFHEDLGEGRLVGRTEHEALANLKTSPPAAVEGSEVLRAVGTPKVETNAGAMAVTGGMELD